MAYKNVCTLRSIILPTCLAFPEGATRIGIVSNTVMMRESSNHASFLYSHIAPRARLQSNATLCTRCATLSGVFAVSPEVLILCLDKPVSGHH